MTDVRSGYDFARRVGAGRTLKGTLRQIEYQPGHLGPFVSGNGLATCNEVIHGLLCCARRRLAVISTFFWDAENFVHR